MTDQDTTLQQLKTAMADFVKDRNWEKYHRPKNLAMSIAVEAGELMELFQWLDHDEGEAFLQKDDNRRKVADEMSDLLAYLLALSQVTGIDLSSSFQSKMDRNDRKYPADKVRGFYARPRDDS